MPNNLLAVTGNIATGKSYIADIIRRDFDFAYVDADRIGHRVLDLPEVSAELRALFGPDIFTAAGTVDRKALGAQVFAEPHKLASLNALTHPHIIQQGRQEVQTLLDAGHRVLFEAAVLFEAGWEKHFPAVLLTVCHESEQLDRVMRRLGCPPDEALRLIHAQMPQDEKLDRATYVIDTTFGPRAFRKTLELIVKDITG